jgi:hypothetical protein
VFCCFVPTAKRSSKVSFAVAIFSAPFEGFPILAWTMHSVLRMRSIFDTGFVIHQSIVNAQRWPGQGTQQKYSFNIHLYYWEICHGSK